MMEYPIKRTHVKALPENITAKLTENFGIEPEEKEGKWMVSFGALEMLEVSMGANKKSILISTVSKQGISDDGVILDTNKRFRKYLDDVTGYSTKERVKKAKSVE
jgi:hypothetical protein